jgi:hypothetical protein
MPARRDPDSGMRETLLDLLWCETVLGRLSPEMEAILTCHLSACRVCGMRFDEFKAAHRRATISPKSDAAPWIPPPS